MTSSEKRDNDPDKAAENVSRPGEEVSAAPVGAGGRRARPPASRLISAGERERRIKEVRAVEFPVGLRGYDRAVVDRYVEQVNRLLAELEMSSSPESAVRHALDEVSEETRDILQHAHHTAEEITARSRAKADDRLQGAEREAQQALDGAQREASQVREAANQEAAQTREAASHEAAQTREVAQRQAQELRDTTATEVQKARDEAQREVAELRATAMHETAALRETVLQETQELRATAQREADEERGSARRAAEEMLERAETRVRQLTRNAEEIWRERRRTIDEMRALGEQLVALADVETKRLPRFGEELGLGEEPPPAHRVAPDSEPVAAAGDREPVDGKPAGHGRPEPA